MVKAQEWLDKNYPLQTDEAKKKISLSLSSTRDWINDDNFEYSTMMSSLMKQFNNRKDIKKLDISQLELEGFLNLQGFTNLEELNCRKNYLTKINIRHCSNLKKLDCSDNYLTMLITKKNENQLLEELDINNNNFPERDLSFLSHLKNLKVMKVGNQRLEWRIKNNLYNRFEGSLKTLENLTNLKELNINATDIDSDLEFLPVSLEKILCWSNLGSKDWKVRKIKEQLQGCEFMNFCFDDLIKLRGRAGRRYILENKKTKWWLKILLLQWSQTTALIITKFGEKITSI